jgi:hypothetical protein
MEKFIQRLTQHQENDQQSARLLKLLIAVFAILLFSSPQFFLYFVDASFVAFANEPISYRYFHAARVAMGEGGNVWLPQGQLTDLLYQAAYAITSAVMYNSDLFSRVDAVGLLYGSFVVAMFAALMVVVVLSRYYSIKDALLVAAIPPALTFLLTSGFTYAVSVDYQHLDFVLFAMSVAIFVCFWADRGESHVLFRAAILGSLIGLCAANKLSMPLICVPTVCIFAADLLEKRYKYATLALAGAFTGGLALAVFIAVYLAHYRFSPTDAATAFSHVLTYASHPGTHEPQFLKTFGTYFVFEHYAFAILALLVSCVAVLCVGNGDRRDFVALGSFLAASGLYGLAIFHRPATSTGFDAACSAIALTAMAMCLIRDTPILRYVLMVSAALALFAGWRGFSPQFAQWIANSRSRETIRIQPWLYAKEIGAPIIAVVPDNRWAGNGGPIITLIKGLSDFPTWNIAKERSTFVKPLFKLRSDQGGNSLAAPYPDQMTLIWEDVPEFPPLPSLYPALAAATASRHCKQWIETGTLHVCPPPN